MNCITVETGGTQIACFADEGSVLDFIVKNEGDCEDGFTLHEYVAGVVTRIAIGVLPWEPINWGGGSISSRYAF